MDAVELEDILGKKQQALEKIEHAVAQEHLDPPKVKTRLLRLLPSTTRWLVVD